MVSKNWKKMLLIVAAIFAIVSVTAFAGGQSDKSGAKGILNAKGKQLSIVAVDFPQWQPYKVRTDSERKACEDYGIKYTLIQPPKTTIDSYVETMTTVVNDAEYDAIIFEPWDYAAFKPVLEIAKKKGLPCVSVHMEYPEPDFFVSMLFINNEAYGVTAADTLGKATGGKANVLFMMNAPDIPNQVTQRKSFIARCDEKWPNIKVVDTQFTRNDTVNASKVLEASLKAYPEIDTAIWVEGATVTVGVDVAKEMGLLGKLKIIGIDDPPDVVASIAKGEAWGSFNQNFQKQGYEAVRNLVDYFTKQPFPKKTDCGIVLINKDNASNYLPDMWKTVAVKGKPYTNLK